MKTRNYFQITLVLMFMSLMLLSCTSTASAPEMEKDAPLFINLTSDDPHRVNMALSFGMKQLERGHPLTVFLNDKGVYVGSTANASQFTEQQKTIATLVDKGTVVFICPMCMEHNGVQKSDVLPGLKVSDPDSIGEYLFKPKTRTLNW